MLTQLCFAFVNVARQGRRRRWPRYDGQHVLLQDVLLQHVLLQHVLLQQVLLQHVLLKHVLLQHVLVQHVLLHLFNGLDGVSNTRYVIVFI